MAVKIVAEESYRDLPEIIVDWINARERDKNRRSNLQLHAKLSYGTTELSFKKPEDEDKKILWYVKKADRYDFGAIYTSPEPSQRLSKNASDKNWVFIAYRNWLPDAKLLANELEREFKVDIEIVVINKLPNKNFGMVSIDY